MKDFSDTHPASQVAAAVRDGRPGTGHKSHEVAFRLFLVMLLVSVVVPISGWAFETWHQLAASRQAAEASKTWDHFRQSCEEVRSVVGNGGVCAQTETARVSAERFRQIEDEHAERAAVFRNVLLLVPGLLVLCFYTGRWVFTGKLRPFWPTRRKAIPD